MFGSKTNLLDMFINLLTDLNLLSLKKILTKGITILIGCMSKMENEDI